MQADTLAPTHAPRESVRGVPRGDGGRFSNAVSRPFERFGVSIEDPDTRVPRGRRLNVKLHREVSV